MKRARVLRGDRQGQWGKLVSQSAASRTGVIEFEDGTTHEYPFAWIIVVTGDSTKSRFNG